MIRIQRVEQGSIADDLALPVGLAVLTINGHPIRDGLDLLYHQAEEGVALETETAAGERVIYEIEKHPDEPLGIVPEPDKIRRCTNACPFCFVKGNPKRDKLRAGLYIKDDDYRLSFLYGHYVTLTNLRPDDWDRIFEQRLSPLYVSVHATDPEVRLEMLKNPRSADIGRDLDRLADGQIEVHAQVVLCPEVNDGAVLRKTIEDLYGRGERVRSLSVVPVGLTEFNADRGIRGLTPDECRRTLADIDRARERALRERGTGWCYAADELFLQAGVALPGPDYFDDQDLASNGVGAISTLAARVRSRLADLPDLTGLDVVAVTGTSMGPSLAGLGREIAERTGATIRTEVTANTLYGPRVTTAGLLSGEDHRRALERHPDADLALISAHALDDRGRFLDDVSLDDLRRRAPQARVEPSYDLADVLAVPR